MLQHETPQRVLRNGRPHWLIEGRLLPVVAGGDGPTPPVTPTAPRTYEDLVAERGRIFSEMESIHRTASEANRLPDETERARYAELTTQFDAIQVEVADAAERAAFDAMGSDLTTRRSMAVPMVNRITDPPVTANRSLDDLLWAHEDDVAAGSYDRTGTFRQHHNARNAVGPVSYRSEGLDHDTEAPRIEDFRPDHRGMVRSFQSLVGDMALFGMLVDKAARGHADGFRVARSHRLFRDRWTNALRALDVDTAAEGGAWVPTGMGANLHERVRAMGRIAPLFSTIQLPTNPWKWPIEGSDSVAFRVAEPLTDTETKVAASTPGSGAVTFDAEIFGARTLWSRSLEADSALAILPYARMKLVQAFVKAEERAILDGDGDGTHMDADVQALGATDPRSAWDGLRKRALANAATAGSNAGLTIANLHTIRSTMGKYGLDPGSLVFIVGVSSVFRLMNDANVMTVDKMGPNATILNGQLASIYGIPIIASEFVREDLNASGVQDGTTTNRTYALAVYRDEWVMGQRSALGLEVDDSIYRETYQRVIVGFMREDFANINAEGAAADDTSIIYNLAP